MAFASDVYTGNGSTTTFALTFPYVRPEHVVVFVNFVSVAYTYTNSTTVNVSPAPGNGLRVEVRRVTPLANPLIDFTDGSILAAADLDTSNLQLLYVQQELDDGVKQGVFISSVTGLPTGNGKRITNVADPIDLQDAATKNYVLNNVSIGGVPVSRGTGTNTQSVAVGSLSLGANVTGTVNTAVGSNALRSNTSGSDNIAVGGDAAYANTIGLNNTIVGTIAFVLNTSGSNNTALGRAALNKNLTGGENTALGQHALLENSTGNDNTAIGKSSLVSNVSGSRNIAVGRGALNQSTGSENIAIGYGIYPVFNIIAHDNRIAMGSTNATNAYIQIPWTVVSDARDKTNLAPIPYGLNFVKQLKPISFQFKKTRELDEPYGQLRYGFLAQDILALEGPNSVIIDSEDPEKLRYNGESLIPVLVQAIQELTAKVEALQNGL